MSRKPLLLLMITLFALSAEAQTRLSDALPDSITVADNAWNLAGSYSYSYTLIREDGGYTVIRNSSSYSRGRKKSRSTYKETVGNVTNADIRGLIRAINDTGAAASSLRIQALGVDSAWIAGHTGQLFSYVKRQYDNWTPQQIAFTKKELGDYSNYGPAARRALLREGYYYIVKEFALQFRLQCYYEGDTAVSVTASEDYLGLPWQIGDRLSYNRGISRAISVLLPEGHSGNLKRIAGERLLNVLANQVYDDKCRAQLPALAVLEYTDYSNDLKKDFTVKAASEASLDWLEFKKWPQTFRFTLQHPSLHPGIQLQFYAIRLGHSLYPIDSLRHAFPLLRDRIQNVQFLMDYLDANPNRRMNLFFFNHLAITRKHIDDFNKDSTHWRMHDFWVQSMDMYKTNKIKPSFDIEKSIETSKQVECGCNFRLDNNWLLQSIVFEVRDEFNQSSTWILLPDNTPVLWQFQAESVYKFSFRDLGTNGRSVQWPCKMLDAKGDLLHQEEKAR